MSTKYNFQEAKTKLATGLESLVKSEGAIYAHLGANPKDVALIGRELLSPEYSAILNNAYDSTMKFREKNGARPEVLTDDLAANLETRSNYIKNFEAVTEAGKAFKEFALEQTGVNHLEVVKDYSKSLGKEVQTSNALNETKKFEHVLEGKTVNNNIPSLGSEKGKGPELNV